jgi:hypothetical protein
LRSSVSAALLERCGLDDSADKGRGSTCGSLELSDKLVQGIEVVIFNSTAECVSEELLAEAVIKILEMACRKNSFQFTNIRERFTCD